MNREFLDQLAEEYKEKGTFTAPILWVDDDGVEPAKLKMFSLSAKAEVVVVNNSIQAITEWEMGKYLGLIVDNFLNVGEKGIDVIETIWETGQIPSAIALVTSSEITREIIATYRQGYVFPELMFSKSADYGNIGQTFRQTLEDCMQADGILPTQWLRLKALALQHKPK